MKEKSRGNAKLRYDEVICIRALRPTTTEYRLAKVFNVSRRTIWLVVSGMNYKYLPLNPEPNFCLIPWKIPGMRTCSGCNESLVLNAENFHKKGRGFQYKCKLCMKILRRLDLDYVKEIQQRESLNLQQYA